ncbi:MAG: nucleotidyltransferase domain-containing protein [Firmicutes bacterium]|nr:nucleotidyltransferase domain-containing protein [Bacillota bacterium]
MTEFPALAAISDPRLRRAAEAVATRLAKDPSVLALGVFGSAVEERAWDRSDVDLWLILDEDQPRHEAAGILEQGTEVSFQMASRESLPRLVERSRGSPMARALATSRWLWCRDPQVESLLEQVRSFPEPWRHLRTLQALDQLKTRSYEAEKLLYLGEPLGAVAKLAEALVQLARIRLIRRGVYPGRDPIGEVLSTEPQLIQHYRDLTEGGMPLVDRIEQAVEYLDEVTQPLAAGALGQLQDVLRTGSASAGELEDHPAFERLNLDWVSLLGWLVSLGLLQRGTRARPKGLPLAGMAEVVFRLPS